MKDFITLPSMFNAKHTKQALIIGGFDGIGQDFARMSAVNHKQLLLVDSIEKQDYLNQLKKELKVDLNIKSLTEDLSGFDAAENIFESSMYANAFSDSFEGVDMLINVLDFMLPIPDIFELDERRIGKYLDLFTLEQINKRFAVEMLKYGEGEILNVLTAPSDMHEEAISNYKELEERLMDFSEALNEKIASRGVSVHFLSYSVSGLVFYSPDATAAPGQAMSSPSNSMSYVQELLSTMTA